MRANQAESESQIKAIFYCEFHTTFGPKIIFQCPEDFITKEHFDSLNVYLIPKPELQGRLITVNALGYKILGFPTGIDNPDKYVRNRFIFNCCFVCNTKQRTTQYEPTVRKLANYLVHLEKECAFLSDESKKSQLEYFLVQIKDQLNSTRVCTINATLSTTIHLKVARIRPDPNIVQDHHVPVFSSSDAAIIPNQWDLTTQQILPFIDGYRHISRIASEADVEVSLVKACVQNMIYYGIMELMPIFQYSNVYVTTPLLMQLVENKSLQDECLRFVTRDDSQHTPKFKAVLQLYCLMSPGLSVKELCIRANPMQQGIDEKKLIRFGILKGLIRRLHKYPIFLAPGPHSVTHQRGIIRLFDGKFSYDEISCKSNKTFQELEDKVEKHPATVVCWK